MAEDKTYTMFVCPDCGAFADNWLVIHKRPCANESELLAQRLLDLRYPADVFDGSSGASGPMFVVRLREAIEEVKSA